MNVGLVKLLECPACNGTLRICGPTTRDTRFESGELACSDCEMRFPVVNGIPRFVPESNYADNFGLQWNSFRHTQLDSHSGTTITRDRFFRQSGWSPEELRGKYVLDVGCGAGRFAEIALSSDAKLVALDYSSAVDALKANHGSNPNLEIVQGDIYCLPFKAESFDFVYCFGVLQHTPDVRRAFDALKKPLKSGGRIAVDVYPAGFRRFLKAKAWVRPFSSRLSPQRLFALVRRAVPVMLPVSLALGRVPVVGRWLRHVLPISNYDGVLPLTPTQVREWAVLDTFDMLAPRYDSPQSATALRSWFAEDGFSNVEVLQLDQLVGRGRR
jgi:SAM-dependent methyltransferase